MNAGLAPAGTATGSHGTVVACLTGNGAVTCRDFAGLDIAIVVVIVVFYVAFAALSILAAVKIVSKAGYSGWWVLIALVPLVGFVMTLVFAFSKWPILREVEELRARGGYQAATGYGARSTAWGEVGYPPPATAHPPAGWYPTPDGRRRYWDGTAWTDHHA